MQFEPTIDDCPRYLLPFDTAKIRRMQTDFLVIGSGNAGLRATIELADHGNVIVLSKENPDEGNTRYAQGGIAVVLNDADRVDFHVDDTLAAGAGLCDEKAVRLMVESGIERVRELLSWGARFDRDGEQLLFGLEGAHRIRRIVHRGDATGEEMQSVLVRRALEPSNVQMLEHTIAVDLLTHEGACVGALVLVNGSELLAIFARATIVASGGIGQLYEHTSNASVTTGDGVAMALRAGAALTDMEFVQFHPTTMRLEGAPAFLISERVRGEGGVLVNSRGERFMIEYDKREELAPRDVVSRAIVAEMERTKWPCVYLDVTHRPRAFLEEHFPTICQTCVGYGIEIWRDAIPVQAAAHFMMGGIWTGLGARSSLPGLLVCGEASCTFVHGANRLASNSLLEGLVFGLRAGVSAAQHVERVSSAMLEQIELRADPVADTASMDVASLRKLLTRSMWESAGIRRDGETLNEALEQFAAMPAFAPPTRDGLEYANMRLMGQVISRAALDRHESRGAHFRMDYPQTDDANWRRHIFFTREADGVMRVGDTVPTEDNSTP